MATYDLTTTSPSSVKAGDILNCPYSGAYKSILLPKGSYKLECWGAAARKPSSNPGKGGYAAGTLSIDTPTTLYLYAGGQPDAAATSSATYIKGGWNGGGASYQRNTSGDSGAGAGASDICLVASTVTLDSNNRYVRTDASYKSRILVAGGAGGGYSTSASYVQYRAGGYCPSQTTSQTAYVGGMTAAGTINSTSNQVIGAFGYGATAKYTGDDHSGGGGGWYGGGSQGDSYGGGGSSFAWCSTYASYVPSGYSVPTSMYLTNVSLIYGNASMTSPTGTTETGHAGSGYIRITVISVQNGLDCYHKNNSAWTSAEMYQKQSGAWTKDLDEIPTSYLKFKVPTAKGSYTYNSIMFTPGWNNYLSKYMTISGTSSATYAGTYTATFTLKESTYKWVDGTSAPKSVSWTIEPKVVSLPSQSNTLTYNKATQSPSWSNYNTTYMTIEGTTSAKDAGAYTATVTLKNPSAATTACVKWSDGTTEAKTVIWRINILKLTKPTSSGTYTYNGSTQSLSFSNFNSSYETKSGTYSAINAGSYTCYITLSDTDNTQWSDGMTSKVTYTWSIAVKTLTIPTLSANPEYTGSTVSPTFNNYNSTYMTVSGNSGTEIGTYTATFALKSTTNTKWSDGTTANKTVSWQITKASLAVPYASNTYYDGEAHGPEWVNYDSTKMTVSPNKTATEIGEYSFTFTLTDTTHYQWSDGTIENKTVVWKIVEAPTITPYLTFSSPESFTLSVSTPSWDGTLEYTTNIYADGGSDWLEWDGSEISGVLKNETYNLYLRGTGNTVISSGKMGKFIITGSNVSCNGNIEMLLDYETASAGNHPTMAGDCYFGMFRNCTSLTTAPELPATTSTTYCYNSMFNGCTSLTTAPELPATTLADSCYSYMFQNCTSLTAAPELPATTLASSCYSSMFNGCTSLTAAPELPATTLASSCYNSMFNGCTSLTAAPELPATTLANYCYSYMFQNCTSLTAAPELPATTLANSCYSYMFRSCTSLTTAPELPVTTLASSCYNSMFYGCTSLTAAPELPATTLASSCYSSMFNGCTSLTAAPELPAITLANYCYNYMFYECTSLTAAPELPATTLADYCYSYMFYGCTKIKFSSAQTGEYTIPYRIPITGTGTTATNALQNMFASTGGTFTGTPNINTTYYLSNTNSIV